MTSNSQLDSTLRSQWRSTNAASILSMFTSSGTLICCALPVLLVTIGAGASLSTLVSAVPQIVWLSEHKALVFGIAGAMLVIAGVLQWRARSAPCPIDLTVAASCTQARRAAMHIYGASVAIFVIGAFFAFVAPALIG